MTKGKLTRQLENIPDDCEILIVLPETKESDVMWADFELDICTEKCHILLYKTKIMMQ